MLAEAGVFMSRVFTGLARAAFEHALIYAHERKQGGVDSRVIRLYATGLVRCTKRSRRAAQ